MVRPWVLGSLAVMACAAAAFSFGGCGSKTTDTSSVVPGSGGQAGNGGFVGSDGAAEVQSADSAIDASSATSGSGGVAIDASEATSGSGGAGIDASDAASSGSGGASLDASEAASGSGGGAIDANESSSFAGSDLIPRGPEGCPTLGTPCDAHINCTYGDVIELACRQTTSCYDVWMPPWQMPECSAVLYQPGCPQTAVPAHGSDCPFQGQLCAYPDGTDCFCVLRAADGGIGSYDARAPYLPGVWRCQSRQNPAGCPPTAPYVLSRCTIPADLVAQGLEFICRYGCRGYSCNCYQSPCDDSKRFWFGGLSNLCN